MPPSIALDPDALLDGSGEPLRGPVVVEDGVIRAVGRRPSYARSLRLRGTLTPALVDAHLHITGIGLSLAGADLRGAGSPVEVALRLSRARGPIAYGRGWDEHLFREQPGRPPTRRLLDKYIPDRPAVAVRVCGHMAVANSLALSMAQPWRRYPGLVDRENGILYEDAVWSVIESLLDRLDTTSLVRRAVRLISSSGVAAVSSLQCTGGEARALHRLEAEGSLPIAVSCYPEPGRLEEVAGALAGARMAGLTGIKLFADGSLGARTALLSRPYEDDPTTRGRIILGPREILESARKALDRGLRVATHAIGDAALDNVLSAYEALGGGPMLRVEHASLVRPGVEKRLAGLGVHVVVQPRFRVSDSWIPRLLGRERARWAYRLASLARAGARLALSTDAPVEPVSPQETFRAALGLCRSPLCTAEESLTLRQALKYYTEAAAEASGGPAGGYGRIRVGAPAAFALWRGRCCLSPATPIVLG